jgi:hypothetical protein
MTAVAMDRDGNVGAISAAAETFYVFQTLDMPELEEPLVSEAIRGSKLGIS